MNNTALDLFQFHEAFYQECAENLDLMEQELSGMELKQTDSEAINRIFRGAHSITGGAAMFGFGEISEFSRNLEMILDGMYCGGQMPGEDDRELLLESVCCLRGMLTALRSLQAISQGVTGSPDERTQSLPVCRRHTLPVGSQAGGCAPAEGGARREQRD